MNLESVSMRGVLNHEESSIVFPKTGLVVITGPNGGGKSTIIEAVALCLWGKTLRGTEAWSGENGWVEVLCADGLRVRRERRKGKVSLSFSTLDEDGNRQPADTYETMTKAQDALEKIVGPFDVWRRSQVFSSADAAHFTLATDAERKRLLESILGINRFDAALDACRDDLRIAQGELQRTLSTVQLDEEKLASEKRRRDEAKAALDEAGGSDTDPVKLEAEAKRLKALYLKASQDVHDVRKRIGAARESGAATRSTINALQKVLDRIKSDLCPTCNQKITSKMRDDLRKRSEQEESKLAAITASNVELLRGQEAELEELEEEVEALAARVRTAELALYGARQSTGARERFAAILKESLDAIAELAVGTAERKKKVDVTTAEVALLKAVERVLGTKGARAHVLGKALSGLEGVANAWLGRIADPGTSLKISAYTEKKSGGVTDAISIEVLGYGNGLGYRASSGGQRRRIDVSLVLAIGEVAGAAHGIEGGTLFTDEVFDALDDQGVQLVAGALRELAEKRCVVVIAHNATLVEALDGVADMHWEVSNGKVAA